MSRAAYMREYRKRKREAWNPAPGLAAVLEATLDAGSATGELLAAGSQRIAELEEEVRHLKAELAQRHVFNSRPFTPVPKH